jgi:hypothetical protein
MGFAGMDDLCELPTACASDAIALQMPGGKEELDVTEIRYVALSLN